jgi:hypothetical protein
MSPNLLLERFVMVDLVALSEQLEVNRRILSLVEKVASKATDPTIRRKMIRNLHRLAQDGATIRDTIDREIEERR